MVSPDIYDDVHEEALAGRLSAALGRTARAVPLPAAAWASFQTRLGETEAPAALFEAAGYDEDERAAGHDDVLSDAGTPAVALPAASPSGPGWTAPPRTRASRWRVPLIAAASVAVLAVGVAATSTGFFGAGRGDATHAAAPATSNEAGDAVPPAKAGDRTVGDPVSVPIDCAPGDADPCPSEGGLALQFTGDPASKTVGLRASLSLADPDGYSAELGGETASDGTPLGLLSAFGPTGDRAIVFGAAQPEVAQLLVVISAPPLLAGTVDNPAYQTVPTQQWRFVSPTNAWIVGLEGEVHDAQFTDLDGDYHAWAVRVPKGLTQVDLTALDAEGHVLQDRSLNLDIGQISDPIQPGQEDAQGVLSTVTVRVDPTRGVLSEIEASKRAEALRSATESANASMSATSAAAEREASQEAAARASAIVQHVHQTDLQVERASEKALAAQAALSSAEEAATRARAAADALPANASDADRAQAEARREMAELNVAADTETLQRAQALLDEARRQAAIASAAARSLDAETSAATPTTTGR